ncbi:MAG: PstA family ABC transporter permease [Bacilli bacterium]
MKRNSDQENKLPLKRRIKDILASGSTYLFSSFSIIALVALIIFIFSQGWSTLSSEFITGNYNSNSINLVTSNEIAPTENTFEYKPAEDEYFSANWGLAFMNSTDNEGLKTTIISYVDNNANINNWVDATTGKPNTLIKGCTITSVILWTTSEASTASVIVPTMSDAKSVCSAFEKCSYVLNINLATGGQGIRGSLITTLYMILITMAVALPLGIGGAIYLGIYAKNNKITKILRTLIDMITGIPSIIFGLVGGLIFLPLTSGSTSIIAGSLTMACMILPIIIKSTEESLKTIPHGMALSSLALGASQTQTTFRVLLPNALPGILTSALLGIGRVIGESAALIYTAGTAIMDYIVPTQGSASLAVHIWYLMSGEHQNFAASCGVAIIILAIILALSILIKIISYRINKTQKGK